jgi:hypothetical protein
MPATEPTKAARVRDAKLARAVALLEPSRNNEAALWEHLPDTFAVAIGRPLDKRERNAPFKPDIEGWRKYWRGIYEIPRSWAMKGENLFTPLRLWPPRRTRDRCNSIFGIKHSCLEACLSR